MSHSDRRDRIVEYLRIKPTSHGQIHTELITIPNSQEVEISFERRENLKRSLVEQGSNLIPIIVRRTEDYSEEGYDYEVVYGADWCLVAKESNIEKLWVWVFDLNDEQAAIAKAEMENLVGSSSTISSLELPPKQEINPEKELIQKLYEQQLLINEQLNAIHQKFNEQQLAVNKQFQAIHQKLETLISIPSPPPLTTLNSVIVSEPAIAPSPLPTLNLATATKAQIDKAVKPGKQADAIWNAIQYWRQPGKSLTWKNLEKSTKTGKDKIKDFAKGTYEKLKAIAHIPN